MLAGHAIRLQNWAMAQFDALPRTMPNDPCPVEFRERWFELLDALDTHALADEFVVRVSAIPHYRDHLMAPTADARIETIARESFAALIPCLDDRVDADESCAAVAAAASPLGVRRARAGVPTEALVSAIRLDFAVIWNALQSMQRDAHDARVLVDRTARVWGVVETYAAMTLEAYQRERARIALEGDAIVRGHVATLLAASAVPEEAARLAAEALGLDPDGRFVVVAVADPFLDRASGHLNDAIALGARAYLHPGHRSATMLWLESPTTMQLAEQLDRVPCGMVPGVEGAAEIPTAAATATLLAGLLRPDDEGALDEQRGWTRIARAQFEVVGYELARDAHRALRGLAPNERNRLRATVRAYLHTGSVPEVARRLHFHRNTVLNHVRRFEEVTGLDVTVPHDAALVLVAGLADRHDEAATRIAAGAAPALASA